jgi:SDR family mycofactocin-dependent oxidoreductase
MVPPMGRLEGKVAFITGAARGQGRAHAVRLASEGANIIGVDICAPLDVKYAPATLDDLHETADLVAAEGRKMTAVQADVRELDELEEAVARGLADFGRLDVVIANAGVLTAGLLWEITEEHWQQMIDVNLTGVWHTMKATVPTLIEQGQGGSIIIVSSVAGLRGVPFVGHYVAAKHGAVGLCRTLANEVGAYKIRVNSIHPAAVDTRMNDDPDLFELVIRFADTLAPIFMNTLPYTMMDPSDVSNLVAFLASDESLYITGAQLPIDFGTLGR